MSLACQSTVIIVQYVTLPLKPFLSHRATNFGDNRWPGGHKAGLSSKTLLTKLTFYKTNKQTNKRHASALILLRIFTQQGEQGCGTPTTY